jgi:hypothetical protein
LPATAASPLALGEFVSEARQLVLKFDETDQPEGGGVLRERLEQVTEITNGGTDRREIDVGADGGQIAGQGDQAHNPAVSGLARPAILVAGGAGHRHHFSRRSAAACFATSP